MKNILILDKEYYKIGTCPDFYLHQQLEIFIVVDRATQTFDVMKNRYGSNETGVALSRLNEFLELPV